jgi:hypothetical protein
MRRPRDGRRSARDERRVRREREVAEALTFLEKLVLRAQPTRQVPAESGVRFAVSSRAREDGICLVFKVDDPEVPIVHDGPRPDYLVVHASREGCILTIVEMKGTEEKNVERGIEQIRAMYRRLREEMARTLPGSWRRACIQGVLLMPYNAQVNPKKISEAAKEGLEILPLQYNHQAELYPYVSKKVSRTAAPYKHAKLPRDAPELNAVERLIVEGKLRQRVRGRFFAERRGDHEDTFFLSFRRPGDPDGAHVSLSATTRDAVLGFSPVAAQAQHEVETHLERHALSCPNLVARVVEP